MADILVQGQGQGSMDIFKRATVSLVAVAAAKGKIQFASGGHFIQRRETCTRSLNFEVWALNRRFIERVSQHWRQQYQCFSDCTSSHWDAKLVDHPSSELMKIATRFPELPLGDSLLNWMIVQCIAQKREHHAVEILTLQSEICNSFEEVGLSSYQLLSAFQRMNNKEAIAKVCLLSLENMDRKNKLPIPAKLATILIRNISFSLCHKQHILTVNRIFERVREIDSVLVA